MVVELQGSVSPFAISLASLCLFPHLSNGDDLTYIKMESRKGFNEKISGRARHSIQPTVES